MFGKFGFFLLFVAVLALLVQTSEAQKSNSKEVCTKSDCKSDCQDKKKGSKCYRTGKCKKGKCKCSKLGKCKNSNSNGN
ncbi:hypothetical protein M3Y97_01125300 [Aphelenchoides bicaudatus]|nr:hypothetical protein M3Y97_01125300 [Aphelenchoides bicaudatus]